MASSLWAGVTVRLTLRRTVTFLRGPASGTPSTPATVARRLPPLRRGNSAAKRPLASLRTLTRRVQPPPERRSIVTVTAAAGATRPETAARSP